MDLHHPHRISSTPMINRQKADRSINQLLNCLMGGARSKASKHLEDHPAERIEFCFKLLHNEVQEIVETSKPSELSQNLYVPRMHLDSLNSLKTLNQLIQEVEW
jgi:hypothetical protein